MKYRESGMPSEDLWDTFFTPTEVLKKLGIGNQIQTLIDIGCGYGTFLLPATTLISGTVVGIDIDEEMINICKDKINANDVSCIDLIYGDILTENTMKLLRDYKDKIDYITLFNILHGEEPLTLLKKAFDVLNDNGRIGVIHWKNEETPRGPSMDIRPTPEMIIDWAEKTGFVLENQVDLPPYHFGLVFIKKQKIEKERIK